MRSLCLVLATATTAAVHVLVQQDSDDCILGESNTSSTILDESATSIKNVDKPADREHKRTTLCPNGKVVGDHEQCKFEEVCMLPDEGKLKKWTEAAQRLGLQVDGAELTSTAKLLEELSTIDILGKVGGGRSKAAYMVSGGGLFFLKSLDAGEAAPVQNLEDEYYEHLKKSTDGQPSFLTTIGLCKLNPHFKVGEKSHLLRSSSYHTHALVMVSLRRFPGITQSFDLKGSKWKNMVDHKKRRCNDEFWLEMADKARKNPADGEDLDFVSLRSDSYRKMLAQKSTSDESCWEKEWKGNAYHVKKMEEGLDKSLVMNRSLQGSFREQAGASMYFPTGRWKQMWAQLERDVAFLSSHSMMDYSLILQVIPNNPESGDACKQTSLLESPTAFPVAKEAKSVVIGIVDFYTVYSGAKAFSKMGQAMFRLAGRSKEQYKPGEPFGYDTVDAEQYADRFTHFFKRWLKPCQSLGSPDCECEKAPSTA